jgi:hypothetical protein
MYGDQEFVRRAFAGLVLGNAYATADNIGPEHFNDIAATLTGVEQQCECETLPSAERPAAFELGYLCVRPGVIRAEPIRLQSSERIVSAHAGLNRIRHYLGQNRSRQVGHAGASSANFLDDVPGGDFGKVTNEPVTMDS